MLVRLETQKGTSMLVMGTPTATLRTLQSLEESLELYFSYAFYSGFIENSDTGIIGHVRLILTLMDQLKSQY